MKRALTIGSVLVATLLVLVVGYVLVLTHTDFGRERARRIVLGFLKDRVKSDVSIGRIEGNLLGDFALVDVAIADEPGHPFLTAKRVTASILARSLLSKRVIVGNLSVVDPVVRLVKTPTGEWNYKRIFPTSPDTSTTEHVAGFGDWIELRDVQVTGGRLTVLQPWLPDEKLKGAARDSAITVTLAGQARARVEKVEWGYRQTMDFRSIDGQFPAILIAHPDSQTINLQVARLRMVAVPFNPPEVRIEEFSGDVRVGDDTVTARNVALRLPGSRIHGSITYLMNAADLLLAVKADTLAFADVRALYPPLPDRGGGTLTLDAAIREKTPSEYVVRDAQLRIGDTRVEGALGLITSDSITQFHDTDVRFTRFPTSLLEQLVPGVEVPVRGTITGRGRFDGPIEKMQIDVDGTFDPANDRPFRIVARGGAGYDEAILADKLTVRVAGLPVTFLRQFVSDTIPIGGTLSGNATLSGSSATRLAGRFSVTHSEAGHVSQVSGNGSVAPGDSMRMDLRLRFTPVSLELAEHFAPKMDLQGVITGTGQVRGTPDQMIVRLDLTLPSGTVEGDARVKLTGATPAYTATVTMHDVDIHAVAPALPTTTLNGVTTVDGEGTDPAILTARLTANLRDFVVDSTRFLEAVVAADARAGDLTVDTLRLRTAFGTATAAGTFGLVEGHDGTLTYRVDVESLAGLQRWIATGDTTLVAPRPGVRRRTEAMLARADSIRQARAAAADTNDLAAALAAEGRRPRRGRRVTVPDLRPIARDSINGSFHVTGDLTGNLERFTARGSALTDGIVWGGNEIGRGKVDFVYADAPTPDATLTAEAGMDSLRAAGFAFDSTHIVARYKNGEGGVELSIFPGDTAIYQVNAEYTLRTGEGEVRLRDIKLQFDTTAWNSARPSVVRWRGRGFEVDSLELRSSGGGGRIFVNGEVPDVDRGSLDIAVDSLWIAPWLTLLQSDVPANGLATFRGRIEGTRLSPRMKGTLSLERPTYTGLPFPGLRSAFDYDQRKLVIDGELRNEAGTQLASVKGSLPIDLSLGDSIATRLLDGALTLDVVGDSIPLAPLRQLTEELTVLDGRAYGAFGVRGTYEHPRLEGELGFDIPSVGLASTGITFKKTIAHVRMSGDSLLLDSLVTRSGGTILGGGSVLLASLTHPVLNLSFDATDARVLDNEMGELFADSRLRLTGALDTLSVTGNVTITRGVVYIPDPDKKALINTGDPAIFAVVDSATAFELNVASDESSMMQNMSVDVALHVARGTWARSQDANVEMYGDLDVHLDPGTQELTLTGALFTDQGEYTFMGHRFVVTQGSVRFTGEPDLNPVLQVLATYGVRQAGRPPIDIRVVIGGTLEKPKISLESTAQPTLSQSDLISFLAFGKSSSSLLQFQGSGLQGGGPAGSSLAGNVAVLATRQLASIAIGAVVDEAKSDLMGRTRADVFNITPADLPIDLKLSAFGTVLRGTEIEIGKYVDRRTFFLAQIRTTLAIPGFSVEHRLRPTLKLKGSFETRFQPQIPSLTAGVVPETIKVVGGLLSWTLKW